MAHSPCAAAGHAGGSVDRLFITEKFSQLGVERVYFLGLRGNGHGTPMMERVEGGREASSNGGMMGMEVHACK